MVRLKGYSGTPLPAKLGIKPGAQLHLVAAPAGFRTLLSPLPDGVRFVTRLSKSTDLVHCFFTSAADLKRALPRLRKRMRPDAVLWVSWPKRTARVTTDLTENAVRDAALPLGLVDVKVCAIDEVWSGLKLVVRKALRG